MAARESVRVRLLAGGSQPAGDGACLARFIASSAFRHQGGSHLARRCSGSYTIGLRSSLVNYRSRHGVEGMLAGATVNCRWEPACWRWICLTATPLRRLIATRVAPTGSRRCSGSYTIGL